MQRQIRYGKEVTGICKICEAEGYTEIHHIISQSKIRKLNRPDLTTNPNNLIELCKTCHDWTDSSTYSLWYRRQGGTNGGKRKRRTREEVKEHRKAKRERRGLLQCKGHIKNGRRCEMGVGKKTIGYCNIHRYQRKSQEEE